MERQVGTLGILGIVLVALGALVGLGFAAFSLSRGTSSDGVQEVASQVEYVSKSKFDTFNDREVSGTVLKTFMEQSKGNHIVFAISHRAFKPGQKVVQNRWVMGHNQAIYCIYGKIPEKEIGAAWYKVNVGDDCPKWTNEAYLFEKKDSCSLIFKGTFSNMSDFNYESLNMVGSPEYIDSASSYKCNLIYDVNDSVIGVIARQQNRPTAAKRDVSVFEVDSVLGHINKTDGGNIPLAPVVVWGESGGKKTLIREDGKAGSGFGEVGLSKDKVDTSIYDSIPDNNIDDFVFEDEAKTILIGYKGSSPVLKIPDSVVFVKSLTSDGSNEAAYKSKLNKVTDIVVNAGCVKIDGLDLTLTPNIKSVYISPTTTVVSGTQLNLVQMEAPKHLYSQIGVTVTGDSYKDSWDAKLYNCGCPTCNISDNDYVLIWDGLDIVGYSGVLPETLEIPFGCTGLSDKAFRGGQFTNLILPNTVTKIGKQAFMGCMNVKFIDISNCTLLSIIDDYTFADCGVVEKIKLPTTITNLNSYAFLRCVKLLEVQGVDNVTTIGKNCFSGCDILNSLPNMNSLESVDSFAFQKTDVVNTLDLSHLKFAGDEAFYNAGVSRNGDTVTISGELGKIPYNFMRWSGVSKVVLQEGITEIGKLAFSDMGRLTDIWIPASVTKISSDAFANSKNVKLHFAEGSPFGNSEDAGAIYNEDFTILIKGPSELGASDTFVIRDTCKTIASNAFTGCTLGAIIIPDSVTTIRSFAFQNLKGVTELTFGPNLSAAEEEIFNGSSITHLNIDANCKLYKYYYLSESWAARWETLENINTNGNPYFKFEDGAFYIYNTDKSKCALVAVKKGLTSLRTIDDCTDVAYYALPNSSITTLDLNNVKVLHKFSLTYGLKISKLVAPNVTTIADRALSQMGASSISFEFPKLETLANRAAVEYPGPLSLKNSIKIGPSLKALSKGCFAGTSSGNTVKSIDLSECLEITNIPFNCFMNMNSLTTLKLPPNLEIIEESSFVNVNSTLTITIPESVKKIENAAFINCNNVSLKVSRELKDQAGECAWGIPMDRIYWY